MLKRSDGFSLKLFALTLPIFLFTPMLQHNVFSLFHSSVPLMESNPDGNKSKSQSTPRAIATEGFSFHYLPGTTSPLLSRENTPIFRFTPLLQNTRGPPLLLAV
ncbi:MAG: hypothetical protein GY765_29715 [bacterium]|nr:hypothetical protein [bacterium]